MSDMIQNEAFLRAAAVTSVLDATLLATTSARIGKRLGAAGEVAEIGRLSERLADFLKFVTLAEAALADGQPGTASYLGGFRRELLAACDRIQQSLVAHELSRAASELDWIAALLGDYTSFGGEVAIALRTRRVQPAA